LLYTINFYDDVNLVERICAQKSANASAERVSSLTGGIKAYSKLPLSGLTRLSAEAGVESGLSGKGAAAAASNVYSSHVERFHS
jgi:hypothetical protein